MLSDAPAHHLLVLMSPVKKSQTTLPEVFNNDEFRSYACDFQVLVAIQVAMEGRISKDTVTKSANWWGSLTGSPAFGVRRNAYPT